MNYETMHAELALINRLVLKPCKIKLTKVEVELESREYSAHSFQLDGQNIKFRQAKITPKKTGQFVTIWKRNQNGITIPFNISDDFCFFIIATRQVKKIGFFIFPKIVLHEHRILSDQAKVGKLGIRVYSPWDLANNQQAKKTQYWQTKYFLDLSNEKEIDLIEAKRLFNINR